MGWLKSLFGPPSQNQFARMVMARLRRGGISGALTYNAEEFAIRHDKHGVMFLHNAYAEYGRVSRSQQRTVLDRLVILWSTTQHDLPEDFNDVRSDLMPMLRSRTYFDWGLLRASGRDDLPEIPYETIGESLGVGIAYDLPTSLATINAAQLEKWGVSFYEAMEIAKQNLHETTKAYAQMGSLFAMTNGDAYDASRLVLTDWIRSLDLQGAPVAMVPQRDALFVTGADDDAGLTLMSQLAKKEIEHERSISGLVFKLVDDQWEVWMPAPDHPEFNALDELRLRSWMEDYTQQKHVLEAEQARTLEDYFVASFSGIRHEDSGRVESLGVWTQGIRILLPRTDVIAFVATTDGGELAETFRAGWDDIQREVGHLMQPQEMYPPRWLVESFPAADELARLKAAS